MGGLRFAAALFAMGFGVCALHGPAIAATEVQIVEVPAGELALHCGMGFEGVPAERVIVCRGGDGLLYVPTALTYNEQGFIYEARYMIGRFCSRREAGLPVLPVRADVREARLAKPPISGDNIACR